MALPRPPGQGEGGAGRLQVRWRAAQDQQGWVQGRPSKSKGNSREERLEMENSLDRTKED